MNKSESDESQNQGFHVNQPCIDSHNLKEQANEQKNIKKFYARYITGNGVLRKQPKECHKVINDIPIKDSSFAYVPSTLDKNQEEPLLSAHQVYNNLNEYSLVYSRNKEPFGLQYRSTFQNEVNLKCCEVYKEDSFKLLRDFDEKSLQQEPSSENQLVLDSRFESGNLLCAYKQKKQQNSYSLFLQNDTNSYGYNQWFYFSIRKAKKNVKYTFKIANYRKMYSFFKLGLKPLVFSLKKAKETGNGWYRDGMNITYYQSNFREAGCTPYYTLQFSLQVQYENDYITLSPYAPYSYSRLMKSLQNMEKKAVENDLTWKLKSIAQGLTKTQIPYITVTKNIGNINTKQNVVFIARQHSGQTWSSYLIQDIMSEIVEQQSDYCRWLTENYVIRIFPMVNVDGVIYGNFRCDLAGFDLNRTWKSPYQSIHPQVHGIQTQLQRLNERNGISICLDLHTHSKQFGAFAYCCVQSQKGRQLPLLLSKITPIFRFPACTFGISAVKESTARASIFNLTKNMNIVTIELSAFGFKTKTSKQPITFLPASIRLIAKSILYGYFCYSLKKQPAQLEIKTEDISITSNSSSQLSKNCRDDAEEEDYPVFGSDSQPEVDQIETKVKIKNIFPDKFIEDINNAGKKKKIIKNIRKISNHISQSKPIYEEKTNHKKNKIASQVSENTKSNKTQTKQLTFLSVDSIDDSTIVVSPSPNRKQKRTQSNTEQPLYKKHNKIYAEKSLKVEIQRPTKPLNLIEFSLKKLPIVAQDKIQPNLNYVMDESFPIVGGISMIQKQQNRFDKTFSTYQAMCRPRVRANSRKVGLNKQKNHRLQQQLPYLCVMSQNKRLLHFQNIKDKVIEEEGTQIRTFHNSILNGHNRQRATKLKNSHKYQNGDLALKINDQFARYDELINSKKHRN